MGLKSIYKGSDGGMVTPRITGGKEGGLTWMIGEAKCGMRYQGGWGSVRTILKGIFREGKSLRGLRSAKKTRGGERRGEKNYAIRVRQEEHKKPVSENRDVGRARRGRGRPQGF